MTPKTDSLFIHLFNVDSTNDRETINKCSSCNRLLNFILTVAMFICPKETHYKPNLAK